jgi:hypothetical protein
MKASGSAVNWPSGRTHLPSTGMWRWEKSHALTANRDARYACPGREAADLVVDLADDVEADDEVDRLDIAHFHSPAQDRRRL